MSYMLDLQQKFLRFKKLFLEMGVAEGKWTEEVKRDILDRPPRPDEEHDAEVWNQLMFERFMILESETDGHITSDQRNQQLVKTTRKFGWCAQCPNLASLRCGKCKEVHYCGKACQKAHWVAHKQTCTRVSN